MKVKDILKDACFFLSKANLEEAIENEQVTSNEVKSDFASLLKCLNLTVQEIATDYKPISQKEILKCQDGKLQFESLKNYPIDIVSLKNKDGIKVKYKTFSSYIEFDAKDIEIIYNYLPKEITDLSEEIDYFYGLTEKVIAFGVVMEYCFINGLYEDASIWEKRFKDALEIRCRKKSSLRMPMRRWN